MASTRHLVTIRSRRYAMRASSSTRSRATPPSGTRPSRPGLRSTRSCWGTPSANPARPLSGRGAPGGAARRSPVRPSLSVRRARVGRDHALECRPREHLQQRRRTASRVRCVPENTSAPTLQNPPTLHVTSYEPDVAAARLSLAEAGERGPTEWSRRGASSRTERARSCGTATSPRSATGRPRPRRSWSRGWWGLRRRVPTSG